MGVSTLSGTAEIVEAVFIHQFFFHGAERDRPHPARYKECSSLFPKTKPPAGQLKDIKFISGMKFTNLFMGALLQCISVSGQTYYLSQNGSDDNKSPGKLTPWHSLQKLQDHINILKAGDSILFEKGSVFFGTLSLQGSGSEDKQIYLGAYGTGPKPVITGSVEIKNWRKLENNIWVAECGPCIGEP